MIHVGGDGAAAVPPLLAGRWGTLDHGGGRYGTLFESETRLSLLVAHCQLLLRQDTLATIIRWW